MPAPKKSFGLFAFALLVGALLLLWSPWVVPPPVVGPAGPEVGDSGAMATELGGEPEPEREAIEPVAPEESGTGIPVRVVAEATGGPLPGAEVLYYDGDRRTELPREEYEALRAAGDEEAWARRLGTPVMADSQGMVFIAGEWDLVVVGRQGGLFGEMIVDPRMTPPDGAWVLSLRRDATLRVRVVDHLGSPAEGVPIASLPMWQEPGSSRPPRPTVLGETGQDGVAMFPHAQAWPRPRDVNLAAEYSVRPHFPGLEGLQEEFDLDEIPGEPIQFQLPPTGRVVLRTVTPSGETYPTAAFEMKLASEQDLTDRTTWSEPDGIEWVTDLDENDWEPSVFNRVVLGRVYWARAFSPGVVSQPPLVFRGPTFPGQELQVELRMEGDLTFVSGRVIDGSGQPLGNSRLNFRLVAGGSLGSAVSTDEDGRFRLSGLPQEGRNIELESLVFTRHGPDQVPIRGEIRSFGVLHTGENHVGDVTLRPMPLVAAGQVFTDGTPAEEEHLVSLSYLPAGQEEWTVDRDLILTQEADARFSIYGDLDPGRYAVMAAALRHAASERVEFRSGDRNVEIHLQSGGSLQATVLLNGWKSHTGVRLRLLPKDPSVRPPGRFGIYPRVRDEGRATYAWSELVPGEYDLEARVYGREPPAVLIPGVVVPAGGVSEDSRLRAIDLNEEFQILRVTVVDSRGEPIREGGLDAPVVLFHDEAPDATLEGFTEASGTVEVITTEPVVELLVAAQGYQPKVVRGVRTDVAVTLEAWPEIELQLAGAVPALPEGVVIRGALRYQDTRDERRFSTPRTGGTLKRDFYPYDEGFEFSRVGSATTLAVPGTSRLSLTVQRVNAGRSQSVRDTVPGTIEVQPGIDRQTFQVSIPPEALAQALERLARR